MYNISISNLIIYFDLGNFFLKQNFHKFLIFTFQMGIIIQMVLENVSFSGQTLTIILQNFFYQI